jgi:hypothetical protein
MNSVRRTLLLVLLPTLLSGCQVYTTAVPEPDYYYLNRNKKLSEIGRVAIVELDNNSSYPEISDDVTEALFQSLQKKQVFGLTFVHQSDSAWRSLQMSPEATHSFDQLLTMRETLKCDAVLTGTITEYRPYPHMVIGLRLRLVDLTDGQLAWALEQIWDTADKTTEYRIRHYFRRQVRSGFAPLHEELVAVSSLRFVKFVAYEVAETVSSKSQAQKYAVFVLDTDQL